MKKVLNIITILLGLSFYSSVTYAADNWITYQCPKLPKANYFNGKALNLDHHNWKVFVMGNPATFAVDEWRITIEADTI